MNRRSIYRRILFIVLVFNIAGILFYSYKKIQKSIPNNIKIVLNQQENFDFSLPIQADFNKPNTDVISINHNKIENNKIHINLGKPFSIESSQRGNYKVNLKLFGLIHLKQITVDVIDQVQLRPSGKSIGIYVETDGLMVLGTSAITSKDGLNYEPALNILHSGDYITEINAKAVNEKADLVEALQKSEGKPVTLSVRRDQETILVQINPVETAAGDYKIGTWIRDNTQGIGTLTFTTETNNFGALGHGITDIDTGLLMQIKEGAIYDSEILHIVKGKKGTPGEIVGLIKLSDKNKIGQIALNTNQGIYGTSEESFALNNPVGAIPIGLKQEVELGPATILCELDGKIDEYTIEIDKIELNNQNMSKGMIINITDSKLLELTGGIVQGMSGSPIIQNGKLIGAVTHVFIQDPTKGYGTFIENMLKTN